MSGATAATLQALALAKMTAVLGERRGRQLMGALLEQHKLTLGNVDELTRFAAELSKMGGFEGAVGAMLGLQAVLLDGKPAAEPVSALTIASDTPGALQAALEPAADGARTLEGAAQRLATAVATRYASVPLARCYAAMRLRQVPPFEADFAQKLAVRHGVVAPLRADTRVLVLLGTYGADPVWRDRRSSRAHLAIPLVDPAMTASAPLLAALLSQLRHDSAGGTVAPAADDGDIVLRRLGGGLDATAFVRDARTARDDAGRLVVSAEGFVRAHGIRSVLAAGSLGADGSAVVLLTFTQELLERAHVAPFTAALQGFKARTKEIAAAGRMFEQP